MYFLGSGYTKQNKILLHNFRNYTKQTRKPAESRRAKEQPIAVPSAAYASDEKEALGIERYMGMEQSCVIDEQHCWAMPVHFIVK